MNERRVRFTATARRHVNRERAWWLENRDYPDIFTSELEEAVRILALLPGVGAAYPSAGIAGLRRLYLRKLTCHLYYTFDEVEVIVRAMWGARRRRGPTLKSVSGTIGLFTPSPPAAIEHVRIRHRRADVRVTKELLNSQPRADAATCRATAGPGCTQIGEEPRKTRMRLSNDVEPRT